MKNKILLNAIQLVIKEAFAIDDNPADGVFALEKFNQLLEQHNLENSNHDDVYEILDNPFMSPIFKATDGLVLGALKTISNSSDVIEASKAKELLAVTSELLKLRDKTFENMKKDTKFSKEEYQHFFDTLIEDNEELNTYEDILSFVATSDIDKIVSLGIARRDIDTMREEEDSIRELLGIERKEETLINSKFISNKLILDRILKELDLLAINLY